MSNGVAIGVGTAAGVAAFLLAAWHGLSYYEVDVKCEKPKYTVIRTLGQRKDWLGRTRAVAEIRRYAPVLVAEVTFRDATMREALSGGFRQIAGFIFGKNIAPGSDSESSKVAMTAPVTLEKSTIDSNTSQKIAMTAPVTAESVGNAGGEYRVSFVMPSQYTKDTLPKPINDNVKIREIPSRTLAALRWRGGSPSEQIMQKKAAELRSVLHSAGVETSDSVHLWQYHPPFSPPYMRINEVLYEIEDNDATSTVLQQ